jgi:hypothetical protein
MLFVREGRSKIRAGGREGKLGRALSSGLPRGLGFGVSWRGGVFMSVSGRLVGKGRRGWCCVRGEGEGGRGGFFWRYGRVGARVIGPSTLGWRARLSAVQK